MVDSLDKVGHFASVEKSVMPTSLHWNEIASHAK
jgi:hypothetical protein